MAAQTIEEQAAAAPLIGQQGSRAATDVQQVVQEAVQQLEAQIRAKVGDVEAKLDSVEAWVAELEETMSPAEAPQVISMIRPSHCGLADVRGWPQNDEGDTKLKQHEQRIAILESQLAGFVGQLGKANDSTAAAERANESHFTRLNQQVDAVHSDVSDLAIKLESFDTRVVHIAQQLEGSAKAARASELTNQRLHTEHSKKTDSVVRDATELKAQLEALERAVVQARPAQTDQGGSASKISEGTPPVRDEKRLTSIESQIAQLVTEYQQGQV